MLADYKLYYCPKSNKLFIPGYETEPVSGKHSNRFPIEKFRPSSGCNFTKDYPWFEAILLCSFGTWGLMGWDNDGIIEKFTDEKNPPFKSKKTQCAFKDFIKQYPKFAKEVKFAKKTDCTDSVPTTAIIHQKKKGKAK